MNILAILLTLMLDAALAPSVDRSVRDVQEGAIEAWNAGDLERLLSHYAEDAVIMVAGMHGEDKNVPGRGRKGVHLPRGARHVPTSPSRLQHLEDDRNDER